MEYCYTMIAPDMTNMAAHVEPFTILFNENGQLKIIKFDDFGEIADMKDTDSWTGTWEVAGDILTIKPHE